MNRRQLAAVMTTLLVGVLALIASQLDLEAPSAPPPTSDAPEPPAPPRSVTRLAPLTAPTRPAALSPSPSPRPSAPTQPPATAAEPPPAAVPEPPALSEWQPPAPSDPVFDLNADRSVAADEQSRAREILELATQFAHDRSRDGSFPILRDSFDGDARFFSAMDLDADGALSEREFVAFHVDAIKQVRRFDQNHDGAVTVAELGALQTRYDFLDVDHDGLIWAWEVSIMRGRGKW